MDEGRWDASTGPGRPHGLMALLLGLLAAALVGCAPEPAPAPRVVTDDLGREVALPDTVARVVTLAPNLTEIVAAAGALEHLVGVTTADDFPPAVTHLPQFSALPLDFEAIAALDPDLVLATDQVNNPQDAETFAALGLPVFFFSYDGLDGLLASLRAAGRLLGTEAVAERHAAGLEAEIEEIRRRTESLDHRPLTLVLVGDDPLYAFGAGSYVHDMIRLAGGRSATEPLDVRHPTLSDEYVLTTAPDVIVVLAGEDYDPARLLEKHPTWDVVPAVRAGRVYGFDPDLVSRPGPRLVEGVRRLAALLHPGLATLAVWEDGRMGGWGNPGSQLPTPNPRDAQRSDG